MHRRALENGEHQPFTQPVAVGAQVEAAVAVAGPAVCARSRSRSRDRKAGVDARRDDPDAGEGVSLLCRNLGYNTDKEVVRNAFKEFGRVVDVYLPLDYMTKQPRGFAFRGNGRPAEAAAAIDGLDGKVIDNRAVKVLFATQKRKRPDQMQTLTRAHRARRAVPRTTTARAASSGGTRRWWWLSRPVARSSPARRRGRGRGRAGAGAATAV